MARLILHSPIRARTGILNDFHALLLTLIRALHLRIFKSFILKICTLARGVTSLSLFVLTILDTSLKRSFFSGAFSFASGVWYVMLLHINFFRAENTNNGIQWDIGACLYLAYASSSLCGLASCACLCSISCKKHKNSSSRPSMSRNITTSSIDRQVSRCFHQNEEKAEKFSAKNLNKSAPTNVRSYEGRHSTFYQQRAQSKKNSATNFKNKSDTYRNYQYV